MPSLSHSSERAQVITSALVLLLVWSGPACVRRGRTSTAIAYQTTDQRSSISEYIKSAPVQAHLININRASVNELETLPGIGQALAARIIEHREKFGPFRRPEHLIIVRGISDRRFRALRELIAVD